ncbi:MAG TPA: PhaM family polyhydroxyalkanoate granule multifunctional regulatory protein [Caldimonas sp.]|nr:PhaM family polyhydroxyalkanoate granule multifunctional regulatory protein [Caldimonas sp.]
MSDASSFSKLVPGFDFLQSLVKNAGAALPGIGQWVAPTLDPAELDKRINELRTVQYWLEQNAKMLAATIQALEVQRMTLSTLQTMNVQMGDLRESLQLKTPAAAARNVAAPTPPVRARKGVAPAQVIDPMQWWSALTNQFTQLATTALKDTATDAAKAVAGNMLKQSLDGAAATFKAAAGAPAKVASAAGAAGAAALGAAGQALSRPKAAKKRAAPRR